MVNIIDWAFSKGESFKNTSYEISTHAFSSLFHNDFNYTWSLEYLRDKENAINNWNEQRLNYSFKNNKHYFDINPIETIKNGFKNISVEYEYNSYFFRSDEFKKNHDGLHILFSGCSNTEGLGMLDEFMWSKMLLNKINSITTTSGYFNLGRAGNGWHQTINNFRIYVNKFGAPDYFFVLMPNLLRDYFWDNKDFVWRYGQAMPPSWGDRENININFEKEQIAVGNSNPKFTMEKYYAAWPPFLMAWKLFESYCDSLGTKLIFGCWDNLDALNIENTNMFVDSYIRFDKVEDSLKRINIDSIINHPLAQEARDGHPGIIQNMIWSNEFFDFFKIFYDRKLIKND